MAPIQIERGGQHIDLDGRRLLFKHNNQIKVGVDVGRGFGEDARPERNVWGGRLPFVWGGSLKTKKKDGGMGRLHSGGRLLIERHNNQL
jgi:hypothetical protein